MTFRTLNHRFALVVVALCLGSTNIHGQDKQPSDRWTTTHVVFAPEAIQAAAADENFVYAICSTEVAKYDRATSKRVAVSKGDAKHLNSGFLWKGKLYCAHSNYPTKPEKSDLKVLDVESMELTLFKDFGNFGGSLTWAIRRDDRWRCNFARYGKQNGETFLVEFDDDWKELRRFTYPDAVISKLGTYSLSGGIWHNGELLVTGHDDPLVFRLRLPKEGAVLEYLGTASVPFTGQGIAWDETSGELVGIHRGKKQVLFAQLAAPQE